MPASADHFGILSCAAYLPRWRMDRQLIAQSSGWARGMSGAAGGSRSFANWDEDSITMAVEAARWAITDAARSAGSSEATVWNSLQLASTSLPFADRSNAGMVREALNINNDLSPADLGGSRRAATSGLLGLLGRSDGHHLLVASECVDAQPASEAELSIGHGAAGVVVGAGKPLATLKASASLHEDFVDQYRMNNQRFDYQLEARWKRDAGTLKQLEQLSHHVLDQAQVRAADLDWLLLPLDASSGRALARTCGLESARNADSLMERIGNCGAAHPILMLAWALQQAEPGQTILLAGAGQGFDLLLFEVQEAARAHQSTAADGCSVEQQLNAGKLEDNYTRYLGVRGILPMDSGIRAERDNRTALASFYRRHEDITGFNGGLCSSCGKLQFPQARYCVHCHADDTQIPEPMAEMPGEVNSYTEDWLAYSPKPPLMFGNVHFPGSANVMMEFSDFLPGELSVGQRVRMSFRIKDLDTRRNFRRYFWKPTPWPGVNNDG